MSDFETQRLQRLKQLEDKRKRLEEMRKQRAEANTAPSTDEPPQNEEKADVDELVKSLLKNRINDVTEESKAAESKESLESTRSNVGVSDSITVKRDSKARTLTFVSHVSAVNIQPIPKPETYDKEVITDAVEYMGDDYFGSEGEGFPQNIPSPGGRSRRYGKANKTSMKSPSSHADHASVSHTEDLRPMPIETRLNAAFNAAGTTTSDLVTDFNELVQTSNFKDFMMKSTRIMERALSAESSVDIFKDYRVGNNSGAKIRSLKDSLIIPRAVFESSIVKGRPVLDIQTSSIYPELILVAYGAKASGAATASSGKSMNYETDMTGSTSAPGLAIIWSKVTPHRPEFVFNASSPVQTIRFVEEDPNLIIGGCYSGQLLLWDMRAKSLPIHRSSLAGKGHKYPIFAMTLMAGSTGPSTRTASSPTAASPISSTTEFFSSSVDGFCCQWDLSRLTDPIEVFPPVPFSLTPHSLAASSTLSHLNISAVGFGYDDTAGKYAIFGSASGYLMKQPFPYRNVDTSKLSKAIEAHSGLITSIDLHPSSRQLYRNLVVTSSLDWTVKLWNFSQNPTAPLLTFQSPSYDYISDVKWHPINPNIFAAVSSSGDILIYNLSKSTNEHVGRYNASHLVNEMNKNEELTALSTGPAVAPIAAALTRMHWSQDGRYLYLGDSKGSVASFDAQDAITSTTPGEETKFEFAMLQLKGQTTAAA